MYTVILPGQGGGSDQASEMSSLDQEDDHFHYNNHGAHRSEAPLTLGGSDGEPFALTGLPFLLIADLHALHRCPCAQRPRPPPN